jgi:hypothetical protein
MLEYALEVADSDAEEPSAAKSLINLAKTSDPDEIKSLLHDVASQLFIDAGVTYERISKRGEHYSIADEVYDEYVRWFDYPWD